MAQSTQMMEKHTDMQDDSPQVGALSHKPSMAPTFGSRQEPDAKPEIHIRTWLAVIAASVCLFHAYEFSLIFVTAYYSWDMEQLCMHWSRLPLNFVKSRQLYHQPEVFRYSQCELLCSCFAFQR